MKLKRAKWKVKNLGLIGFFKNLFNENNNVYFDEKYLAEFATGVDYDEKFKSREQNPFMLVKPSGYRKIGDIIDILDSEDLYPKEIFRIKEYNNLIDSLYPMVTKRERAYWKQINSVYYSMDNNIYAFVLVFSEDKKMEKINRTKIKIRKKCGIDFYNIHDGQNKSYETSITPVHVPDEKNLNNEYSKIIQYKCELDCSLRL